MTDSQENILLNARYFKSQLEKAKQEFPYKLAGYIIQRCFLVVVSAIDQGSALRIFTVMNDRGLDLSTADLLKVEIVGDGNAPNQPEHIETWESLEVSLGRERFENLFSHIRMIHKHEKARRSITDEFQELIKSKKINRNKFVPDVLEPMAEAYEIATKCEFQGTHDAEINGHLRYLNRIDNFDWVPPLIKFLADHKEDSEKIRDFVVKLERLSYSMFIRRANANKRMARYAALLQSMEDGGDAMKNGGPLDLEPGEKAETLAALDGPIYESARVRLPILLRLDEQLASAGATYDFPTITVEHVLPQNPAKGSRWLADFDEQERAAWTHRLGNLALLPFRKNREAGNHDFDTKKEKYFQKKPVTFAITTQIINEPKWTLKTIEKRQGEFLGELSKVWRLV